MNREELLQLANDDANALYFLLASFIHLSNEEIDVLTILLQENGLRGEDLGFLFFDLCDKDFNKVRMLLTRAPGHVLVDACTKKQRNLIDIYYE